MDIAKTKAIFDEIDEDAEARAIIFGLRVQV
jgi:hypothetical protein